MLRGIEGKERYGLKSATVEQQAKNRLHNLLAIRTAEAFYEMTQTGANAVIMAPALKDRAVSMLRLDEFSKLILQTGVSHTVSNQCDFGARTETLTSWISHGICLDKFNGPCTHPKRWVVSHRTKRWKLAKHETHKGDEKFTFDSNILFFFPL